jgi:O-antigen/teichoic acid export membrane protein
MNATESITEAAVEQQIITGEIKTAVRHSAVYGLGGILVKVLAFFMLPFYTHYLTPVDYGTLEILDLSMSLLGMLLNMGIAAALMRYYAAATSEEEQRQTVSTGFLFVIVTGVLTFLAGLTFIRPAARLILGSESYSKYLLLSFGTFILSYILSLPRTYVRILEKSRALVLLDTVFSFSLLALNILFIAVFKAGLTGILLSYLIIVVIQLSGFSVWTFRLVGIAFNSLQLRRMVGYGLPLILSNLAAFSINFSDRFFLEHLRSLELVGVYAVGYKFGFMLNYLLVQPFSAMWEPRRYIIHAQPNHPKIFGQIFVFYSLVLTYAWLGLTLFSPEVIRVMVDKKFAASQDVIPIVGLAYVFWGIGYQAQLGMLLTNRTNMVGAISAGTMVVNLALNYFLILHCGMLGAAWATLVSFICITVASYRFSQRCLPLPLGFGRVLLGILAAAGLYLLSRWALPDNLVLTLLLKAALLGVFPFLLWKARILSESEARTLGSAWSSVTANLSRRFGFVMQKAPSL